MARRLILKNKFLQALTASLMAGAASTMAAAVEGDEVAMTVSPSVQQALSTLDWQVIEGGTDQLNNPRQQSRRVRICEGFYQEPDRPGLDFQGDPAEAPIFAEADTSSYQNNGLGTLTGRVVVRQGYRQIESDLAHIDRHTSKTDFIGHVVIREPNLLLLGSQANADTNTGHVQVSDAQYVFHQKRARGQAQNLIRHESGIIELSRASYTTCPPGPGACVWQLSGRTVKLNPNTRLGTATHATLDLYGVPVFYLPLLTFPLDDSRKSGLLYPSFAFHSRKYGNGLDYIQPIYWNIAPNMDATITPRIMSRRGALVENEFRYLGQNSRTELGGAYSTPDQQKLRNLNYDQNRWFVNLTHQQQLSDNWDYSVNYTNAGDREYFTDLGTDLNVASTGPLRQEIYTRYHNTGTGSHRWNMALGTQRLQNMTQTSSDPYNKNIDLTLNGDWGEGVGLGFSYKASYTDFQRDREWQYRGQQLAFAWPDEPDNKVYQGVWGEGSGLAHGVGGRLYTEAGSHYRFENSYSFLEPGVQIRSVRYRLDRLDQTYLNSAPSRAQATRPRTTAPTVYLDGGLYLERPTLLADLKLTQTLEPRLRYVYTPHRARQGFNPVFDTSDSGFSFASLWRNDRFTGPDRIGDTHQVSLGVTTRFLEETGYERVRFSVGQIVYFNTRRTFIDPRLTQVIESGQDQSDMNLGEATQRQVDANRARLSPIASQLVWNLRQDLRLTQDWIYNTDQSWNQSYAAGIQYLPRAGSVFNLSYRYLNQVQRAEKFRDGPKKGNNTGRFVDGDLEEATLSAVWPLTDRWSVLSRYTRDLTNRRDMDRAFGFEQDSCCYKMRIMYRKWFDPLDDIDTAEVDEGFFFEFTLKGLGNLTSSRVTQFLRSINGYQKP